MSKWVQLGVLLLSSYFLFVIHLDTLDPDLMEARNFITAQEILEKGNWVTPTMNGELRLKKPPLPTWLTALSVRMGDRDDLFLLRLPAALAATLMLLFMFGLGRQLSQDPFFSLLSALVLGSSLLVMQMGRNGSWDIFCQAFMLGAIWMLVSGWKQTGRAWGYFATAGLLMALSFMSKGPVAFYGMLLPFLICYGSFGNWPSMRSNIPGFGLAIVLAIALSLVWPALVQLQYPDMLSQVVAEESGNWGSKHVRPWYFYGHFPLYMGAWLLFFLPALIWPYASKRLEHYKLFLVWSLIGLLLLSLIPEKKERYLLPLLVPMCLLSSSWMIYVLRTTWQKLQWTERSVIYLHTSLLLMACLALPFFTWYYGYRSGSLGLLALIVLIALVALMVVLLWGFFRHKKLLHLYGLSVAWICLFNVFGYPLIPNLIYTNPDYSSLKESRSVIGDLPVFSRGPMNLSLIFDVGKEVKLWDPSVNEFPAPLPIVVFSTKPLDNMLDQDLLKKARLEHKQEFYPYRQPNNYRWHLSILYPL